MCIYYLVYQLQKNCLHKPLLHRRWSSTFFATHALNSELAWLFLLYKITFICRNFDEVRAVKLVLSIFETVYFSVAYLAKVYAEAISDQDTALEALPVDHVSILPQANCRSLILSKAFRSRQLRGGCILWFNDINASVTRPRYDFLCFYTTSIYRSTYIYYSVSQK